MKKALIVLLLILTPIILTGCGEKKDPNEGGRLESFASCLTEKGLKMYGTERCPHCQNMKGMFGSAFSKINFIDCDKQTMQCDAASIKWYPTWMYLSKPYEWEKTLEELAQITSCELPAEAK